MPAPNLFNIGALFVLLRETLEVCIILSVLFTFITKAAPGDLPLVKRLKRMVWFGAALGLFVSIALGIAFTVVYYVLRQNVFESMEALWEGCFKLIAVILLTWIAFSMLGIEEWQRKWEKKLQSEVEKAALTEPEAGVSLLEEKKGDADTLTENKAIKVVNRPWGLFILSFTVVIREGLESVVFLAGVGQGEPLSIIIPGILGVLIGLAIGYYFWTRTSALNMRKFLIVSSIVLFILSAGLAANAAHEFEEFAYVQSGLAEQARLDETLPPNITAPEFLGGAPGNRRRSMEYTAELPELVRRQSSPTPKRENVTDFACPRNASATGPVSCTVRTYYIAAVEVDWDYAPSGYNHMNGVPFVRDPEGAGIWALHSEEKLRIGSVYKKAMFVEYTDDTYETEVTKPDWLGSLGPIIRAEVGDVIKIKFKNKATLSYTMHPHGVFYNTTSEGAHSEWRYSAVKPEESFEYVWSVPERAGPGPNDGSSILWAYHSHHHEVKDIYSGLVGPLIVYRKGTLSATTDLPNDVSKEFVLYLTVVDESQSHYIEDNIITKLGLEDPGAIAELLESEEFAESNLKHAINGRLYNNLDGLRVEIGESVKWYAMSMGTEVDLHTLHFHGMTAMEGGHRTDVVELLPASFKTITMDKDDLVVDGSWMIHCHVADHITAGMISSFYVAANSSDAGPTWTKKQSDNELVIAFAEIKESTPVLWDASSCCSEEDNAFFQILNALIGWRAVATIATVVTYFGYWALVIVGVIVLNRIRRKKEEAKQEDPEVTEKGEEEEIATPSISKA